MLSMREAYGNHLASRGIENKDIVVLEGDLADSTQSDLFQSKFPDRHFQIGIAEQNMVGMAAGLALEGKIPFVNSFAAFVAMRACEQVRTDVAYTNLNVKFVVSHSGLSAGSAGPSHHCIEDISIMRAIPNMKVFCPGDSEEMRQVIDASLEINGPVYIRASAMDTQQTYCDDHKFETGRATLLKDGNDATIIVTGALMFEALEAANILDKEDDISIRVLQMASVKPIDNESIISSAEETSMIFTIEEHNILGGLGAAVCEVVAGYGKGKVKRLGIEDHFTDLVGTPEYLLEHEGLSKEKIVKRIRMLLNG